MIQKIYNDNALDILPTLSTDSASMIFIDPPYNSTSLEMDAAGFNILYYLKELKRILKPNGWLFCFGVLEMHAEIIQSKVFIRKFEYIWVKSKAVMKHHNTIAPMTGHEIICAYRQADLKKMTELYMDKKSLRTLGKAYTKKHNLNRDIGEFEKSQRSHFCNPISTNSGFREGTTLLKNYPSKQLMKHTERTTHPTQKPLELCKLICKAYCPPDGLILDCFMGSGTIPLAAKITGRQYIGIEINKEYFKIAQQRIEGEKKNDN